MRPIYGNITGQLEYGVEDITSSAIIPDKSYGPDLGADAITLNSFCKLFSLMYLCVDHAGVSKRLVNNQ